MHIAYRFFPSRHFPEKCTDLNLGRSATGFSPHFNGTLCLVFDQPCCENSFASRLPSGSPSIASTKAVRWGITQDSSQCSHTSLGFCLYTDDIAGPRFNLLTTVSSRSIWYCGAFATSNPPVLVGPFNDQITDEFRPGPVDSFQQLIEFVPDPFWNPDGHEDRPLPFVQSLTSHLISLLLRRRHSSAVLNPLDDITDHAFQNVLE